MDRRSFLRNGAVCGALVAGSGGFLFVRRDRARAAAASNMLDDAIPQLTANSVKELNSLPARAGEKIRIYFLEKCLNVQSFVIHVCTNEFAERLGRCRTPDEREICFLQTFCGRVTTETEILNVVRTIAEEIGGELDSAWSDYCASVSRKWNTRIRGYGEPLAAEELTLRVGTLVRTELGQALRQGMTGHQRPAVGETIGKIGSSAVLLLPLARLGPAGLQIAVPVFFVLAAKHVWDYTMSRLDGINKGDMKEAISKRLSDLGNRVGTEFEREVRLRIADLHTWQERSIRETAAQLAHERVSLI